MTSDTVPASERPEPSPLTDYLAGMLRTPNQSHSLTPSDVEKSFDADRGLASSPSSSSTPTTPATDRDRRKSRRQSTPFYTKGIPTSPGPPVTHLDLAKAAEQRLKVPSTPTPMRSDRSPTSPSLSPSATPSSLPTPSPSRSPLSRPPVLRRPTDDGFTERFQYLVASSGLLEKTQILSLVSAQEEDNPPVPPEADDKLQMIVQSQQHRWDIYAASAFVIVSVLYVLGLSMLLVPSAAVAGGAALLLPSKSDSTSEMAKAPQVDSTEAAKEEPKPSEDSTTRVFNTLNALLAESRNLDQAIGTAMSLLAPRPDDLESGHSLRIALHRLFSDMTDSLAGTTSTLIPMADRSELAVLGDMYDIPVLGNRRRRASSSGSEGSTTTPVPHRQRSLSTSEAVTMGDDPSTPAAAAPDANDRFTPLPVRQLRHKRSESRGFDHSPAASPLRPYHSQHQREASVETRGNDGDEAMSVASSSTESSSLAPSSLPEQLNGARPPVGPASRAVMMSFTPKRASPLAHTGHTGHTLERPDAAPSSFPANAAPSSFPASARTTSPTSFHMRPSQSPFRRSLQDIPYIHTPPSSSAEQAAELAKARATSNMSSAKRRSLQTPYNLDLQREQTLVEANAGGLTRASSLQYTNRSAHSDALAALEGKRNVTEPVRSGLRPLTMSASLSTPNKRASSIWNTQISPPKSTPQQQVVESKSRNRNSIILESGSAGTAAMAQSEAMSSRRSSTTLEGQTLLSSPDGSAASKRSSLLLDQGPAGKRVQQLLGEQNALGLGHSPRSASLGVHQPFQRVPSISPLTLGGLKASCHGVHLKRRRVACCLLGLRFAEPRSSSYWDDVCGEMQKLTEAMAMSRESLDSAREEAEKELSAQRALAESAKRHSSPAAPLGNIDDGPVEFAPRSDPMLSSVDELQRTLARVWARCDELRQRGVTLEPDILASIWADVRSDVGGMLRQVERGREAVRSTNVSEAGATDPTDSEIMPISASSADMEPGFLRAWEAVDQEEDEIERLVSGEDVPPDSEPYQEFLPPPGIDEVFEAAIPPAPAPRPKATLSRDERMKAAKEARARGAAMDRLTANSKEPSPEPEAEEGVQQATSSLVASDGAQGVEAGLYSRLAHLDSQQHTCFRPRDNAPIDEQRTPSRCVAVPLANSAFAGSAASHVADERADWLADALVSRDLADAELKSVLASADGVVASQCAARPLPDFCAHGLSPAWPDGDHVPSPQITIAHLAARTLAHRAAHAEPLPFALPAIFSHPGIKSDASWRLGREETEGHVPAADSGYCAAGHEPGRGTQEEPADAVRGVECEWGVQAHSPQGAR
ncbi:hypothetical protein A1Q1_02288 [Trichosporon asahii var. asahii CBS 2479]|uniref:Uncharacterized protein n=1 Tax=Trichosporon asahii var. asahii (strain ATCC 90039 / CBS 2479 / JCM 2466 / KCTC 7840 / NBRC 103889/ NCYC 2677 / UAMH 7654) TaxID=1186058 RepID=J5QRK9_TRIAS|nr:hypothetical protein A1Q1_02288 [Trichosporon asahii var. asahii CBS 2479]EJT48743.1 hypothetical protein A1Q1_02288 [Trichosporon asahii var. asahii CBS 2479]